MGKSKFILPLALLALGACQSQELDIRTPDSGLPLQTEKREVIITAEMEGLAPETRTSTEMVVNGSAKTFPTYWTPGDKIKIFSAGEQSEFTSINTEPASVAKFKGKVSFITGADDGMDKAYVWGVYPSSSVVNYSEPEGKSETAVIRAEFPSDQRGKAGSYSDGYAMSIGRSESLGIYFMSVYSCIYFTFSRSDITSITLCGQDGEVLAGTVDLTLDDKGEPVITPVAGKESTAVALYAPAGGAFVPGEYYYMTMLPRVLQRGLTLTLKRSDGYEGTFTLNSSNLSLNRKGFRQLATPDKRIETQTNIDNGTSTGWVKSETQPTNEIWYTSTDGQIVEYTVDSDTGNEVVSNTYADGKGVIRFKGILTEIDEAAFELKNTLETVSLPDAVETIKVLAFDACHSLVDVKLPGSLKSIGVSAFEQCPFTEIVFPEGLEQIGYDAFNNCDNLKSVTLPESVTTIGAYYNKGDISSSFVDCNSLEAFYGKFASEDHKCLIVTDPETGIRHLNSFALAGMEGQIYAIPEGVTYITAYAFSGALISGVVFPSSLRWIQDRAFFRCDKLKTLTIPSTVTYIGPQAFMTCSSLDWIRIEGIDRLINLSYRRFNYPMNQLFDDTNNCPIYVPSELLGWYKGANNWNAYAGRYESIISNNEIRYTTVTGSRLMYRNTTTLPNGLTHSWDDDTKIGVFTSDNAITEIPADLFTKAANKASLKTVTIPNSVETIADEAFSGCTGLTSVNFGTGLKTIGTNAFYNCYNLESVTLPDGLLTIGDYAFDVAEEHLNAETGYSKLASVYIPESVKEIYQGAFGRNVNLKTINIPAGATVYANPVIGCRSLESFTGGSALIADGGRALIDSEGKFLALAPGGLTSYSVPEGVKTVYIHAMAYLDNLEEVTLPKTLESFDYSSFYNDGLDRIILRGTNTTVSGGGIPDSALSSDYEIWITGAGTSYYTNSSTPYWPDMKDHFVVYQADNEIWFHQLGDKVDALNLVGDYDGDGVNDEVKQTAFYKSALKGWKPVVTPLTSSGNLPWICVLSAPNLDAITKMADEGFSDEHVGSSGLDQASSINWVSLPNTVKVIGEKAFMGCSNLTLLPSNPYSDLWTEVGDDAFNGCEVMRVSQDDPGPYALTAFDLKTIGDRAFKDCKYFDWPILFPSLEILGEYAFYGCSSLPEAAISTKVARSASIAQYAFAKCSEMTKIQIGPVKTIPDLTFWWCEKLEKVILWVSGDLTWIGSSAFSYCTSLKTIGGHSTPEGSAILPAVSTIRFNGVFEGTQIENLVIPKAQRLSQGALRDMPKLTTLDASGLKILQSAALSGCDNLKTLNLPSIQQLGIYALEGSSVQDLTLGEGLISIDKMALANSTGIMNNLYFLGATPPDASVIYEAINPNAFKKTEGGENVEISLIHVPTGKKAAYLDAFMTANTDYQSYDANIVED